MSIVTNVIEQLHQVRAKLYPNFLPTSEEGELIARINDESSLNVEKVCAALINRGGNTANYNELVSNVKQYYAELIYQLCDGFSIDNGYYAIRLKLGGTWSSPDEHFDPAKHPITVHLRAHHALRAATKHITILIDGLAPAAAYIAEVKDAHTGALNDTLTVNEDFIIRGRHIKITKEEPGCGLFLRGPTDGEMGGPEVEIPRYTENTVGKVIARMPVTADPGEYRLIIKTKYAGTTLLKEIRTIESPLLTVSA